MIGPTTFHPRHPEAEADGPKSGIRHSLRFHVHILANETGGGQPKVVTNGVVQSQHFKEFSLQPVFPTVSGVPPSLGLIC